jgi:uncharacterized protein (TIGR02147 family)
MKNVFAYDNYKNLLNNFVNAESSQRGLRTELAKAMGCQAAYLTQVLNSNAELTEDHAFKLTTHLRLSKLEADYFMILVRMSRAGTPDLRDFLEKERQDLLKKNDQIQSRVDSNQVSDAEAFTQRYFSSWIPSSVHIATSGKNFQTVKSLAARFGLPEELVLETLKFLEKHKLVQRTTAQQWVYVGGPLHLPNENTVASNYQINRRLQVIKSLQQDFDSKSIHFSSVFTLDKESYEEIRKLLLASIEKSHKTIHAGGTDEVYGMCVDLFKVI